MKKTYRVLQGSGGLFFRPGFAGVCFLFGPDLLGSRFLGFARRVFGSGFLRFLNKSEENMSLGLAPGRACRAWLVRGCHPGLGRGLGQLSVIFGLKVLSDLIAEEVVLSFRRFVVLLPWLDVGASVHAARTRPR